MSRLSLDISTLQVETFAAGPAAAAVSAPATYPDCPTVTGCTCYEVCQSMVMHCMTTVAETATQE